MRGAAALFTLIVGVFSQTVFDVYPIPAELYTTGNNAEQGICVHATLIHCQTSFNNALNLTSDLDWTDVTKMQQELSTYYLQGIQGFLQICGARQQFETCLGGMYSACMSVTRFVSDGEDANSASEYVQTFKELQFDCNGGFVQLTSSYPCVLGVWNSTMDYFNNTCGTQFNQTLAGDPNNYCKAVAGAEECTRKPFRTACGAEASWWQCERTRVVAGLNQYCPTNYCSVDQPSPSMLQSNRRKNLEQVMKGSEVRNRVMQKLAEKARLRERK